MAAPPTMATSWWTNCFHLLGLGISLFGSRGRFLGVGGVLLDHPIHLGNGLTDLADPLSLLLGKGAAIISPNQLPGLLGAGGHFPEGLVGPATISDPCFIDCIFNQVGSFLAASAARMARLRTSSATTANPAPASPARAASTAAFKARRLVWKAISSMVLIILPVSSLAWKSRSWSAGGKR